jgi:hypothetical protein
MRILPGQGPVPILRNTSANPEVPFPSTIDGGMPDVKSSPGQEL